MKLAFALALALLATPAFAQDGLNPSGAIGGDASGAPTPTASPPALTGNLFRDIANGAKASVNGQVTTIFDQLAAWVGGDLTAARALAIQNPGLQDWNSYTCLGVAQNFTNLLKQHPVPLTLKIASDVVALRLAIASAKQVCMEPTCQAISADVSQGIAQIGMGIPPPATLETICAKIPSINLGSQPANYVAPTATPTPVPTPTPTASP